jgi:outer membrane protein assembly factor BamB
MPDPGSEPEPQRAEQARNVGHQPWSPFPVQDWSTLPADPLGSVAINPTWPAPKAHGPWWRPLLVFGLVAALIAGVAFVASSVSVAARGAAAAPYLPADGAVVYERTAVTRAVAGRCTRRESVERCRLGGGDP